jgi:hypothetical protein
MIPLDTGPFFERLGLGVFAAAAAWSVACGAGRMAVDAIGIDRATPGRPAIAAAVGYALVGSLFAAAGLAGMLGPQVAAVIVALALVEAIQARRTLARVPGLLGEWAARFARSEPVEKAADAATASAIVFGVVAAALPAVWWDPVAYHLPIVARAIAQHGFVFDPAMTQTGFPLLGEAAALPAYAIAGSAGAAMATLGAGIVFALMCGAWAEAIAAGSGKIATALVACSSLWLWLSPSFYVDIPFAMFAVAALASAALRTTDGGFVRSAIVAGLLAGAAAATKYPGLGVTLVAAAVIAFAAPASTRGKALLGFITAAAIVAGGWYVRTGLVTGDPLYPFLTALASGTSHDFAARYVAMTRTWCGGGTSLADALSLPYRLLTAPRSFCGDPGYGLDIAAVFFLAAIGIWRRVGVPMTACFVLTAVWFWSSQQWRFLLPSVGLFAIVSAAAATAVTGRLRTISNGALVALCFVCVLVDVLPAAGSDASNSIAPGYAYIAGSQSGDAYLASRLESYGAAMWLRDDGGGAPAAALDDVRDYYFEPPVTWFNPFYQSVWAIDWSAPPARRYRPLVTAGYRWLIVNVNPAFVGRTPTGVDFDALAADERSGAIVRRYASDGVIVYELAHPR